MKRDNSDNELIKLAISGKDHAYDELISRYQKRVTNIISRHVDDFSIINDLSQEVFIKVFQNLWKFKHNSSFYTWLYRITQNTIKNHYKGKLYHKNIIEVDISKIDSQSVTEFLSDADSPEYLIMSDEAVSMLSGAYQKLSNDLRECILLYDLVGLTYTQIAKELDCPIGTVRSRIHRARSYVQHSLREDLL